jgi:hypothetical protein
LRRDQLRTLSRVEGWAAGGFAGVAAGAGVVAGAGADVCAAAGIARLAARRAAPTEKRERDVDKPDVDKRDMDKRGMGVLLGLRPFMCTFRVAGKTRERPFGSSRH